MQETWIQSLVWEDPLDQGKATHSSILAWRQSLTPLSDFQFSISLTVLFHHISKVSVSEEYRFITYLIIDTQLTYPSMPFKQLFPICSPYNSYSTCSPVLFQKKKKMPPELMGIIAPLSITHTLIHTICTDMDKHTFQVIVKACQRYPGHDFKKTYFLWTHNLA